MLEKSLYKLPHLIPEQGYGWHWHGFS